MIHVASEMERLGLKLPLLIGGATTSKIHTAVKIEPGYSQPVVHVKDASKSVGVVSALISTTRREEFAATIREEHEQLRNSYAGAGKEIEYLELGEARKNRMNIDWNADSVFLPKHPGIHTLKDYPMEQISEYINWIFFFITWELRGKYPDIFQHPDYGEEARKLYNDAREMLQLIIREKWLTANAVFGIFPANASGDDILVFEDESRQRIRTRFTNLRNQTRKQGLPNLCLSDFIAPVDSGIPDYVGAFAVTAGIGIEKKLDEFSQAHDDYSSIMLKALADRLAEAFTELLHEQIRKDTWGYAQGESLTMDELFREKYSGIRPAHGYPACPDHSEKEVLFDLLGAPELGITLTENYSMVPAASVSGLIFAHPESSYFFVGKIGTDQVEDYARRKALSTREVERLLASNLNY
jgi:5-methyltetrahydrofolate--homocysteine methyltransferase